MFSKVSPELKTAVLALPEKEKDKLLLRLIRKDRTLIQQMHFQLLEGEIDLEERRERTFRLVNQEILQVERQLDARKYYNPRDLMLALRSMSGLVNQHFLITKDKTGELEMRLHILNQIFHYAPGFFDYANHANDKLLQYVIGRIKNVHGSYSKLHEDLQFDYAEKFNEALAFAYSSSLRNYLQELAIPEEV